MLGRDNMTQVLMTSDFERSSAATALFNQMLKGSQLLKLCSISFFPAMNISSSHCATAIGFLLRSYSVNVPVSLDAVQQLLNLRLLCVSPPIKGPLGDRLPAVCQLPPWPTRPVVDAGQIPLGHSENLCQLSLRHLSPPPSIMFTCILYHENMGCQYIFLMKAWKL
jgi:hypothetical protein